MRLSARGVATLTVAGRRTGELRKVPVDERGDIIAWYREVAGSLVDLCFTKLPTPRIIPCAKSARRTDMQSGERLKRGAAGAPNWAGLRFQPPTVLRRGIGPREMRTPDRARDTERCDGHGSKHS
jgi:hypothetical protein